LKLALGQIADWIHAEGDFTTDREAVGYSIDSRTIGAGELFFAVKGERMDGHDYVAAALENGAVGAVVSQHWLAPDEMDPCRLMRVPESEDCVLRALQTVANRVRRAWGGRVIGVTGSAGKTTTKEAVAAVLGTKFRVLKSEGNLNNHFGLPLQLLRLEPEHEVVVLEMGMNHAGEIALLAKIARPDWAVVTNVAGVHLEYFEDGIEGIARAKKELIDALPKGGAAILNFDDDRVAAFGRGRVEDVVFYGMRNGADVRAEGVDERGADGVRFQVVAGEKRAEVRLRLLGQHNVLNALAAVATGLRSGIPLEDCARALEGLRPADKRGEVLEWRGARLVNDCYNSNPRALDSMVDALIAIGASRHVVVAGEMLELGPQGEALHAACGTRMAERGVDVVVGVRGLAAALARSAGEGGVEAVFVETPEEAGAWMREHVRPGDAVLLKASRGVRLERALAVLAG